MTKFDMDELIALYLGLRMPAWPEAVAYAAGHELQIVVAVLALGLLLAWRRLRHLKRVHQTLRGEMSRMQMQLLGIERLQFESEKKYGQFDYRISELDARQRRAEARLGKPDTKFAVALTRAGAGSRELVDCGLSHSESHLLQGLNAKAASSTKAA